MKKFYGLWKKTKDFEKNIKNNYGILKKIMVFEDIYYGLWKNKLWIFKIKTMAYEKNLWIMKKKSILKKILKTIMEY